MKYFVYIFRSIFSQSKASLTFASTDNLRLSWIEFSIFLSKNPSPRYPVRVGPTGNCTGWLVQITHIEAVALLGGQRPGPSKDRFYECLTAITTPLTDTHEVGTVAERKFCGWIREHE